VFGPGEAELLDAIADLIAVEAQQRGGAGLVAAGARERLLDQAALELVEPNARRRQLEVLRHRPGAAARDREVRGRQLVEAVSPTLDAPGLLRTRDGLSLTLLTSRCDSPPPP